MYYLISVGLNTLVLQWVFQCFFTVLSYRIPSSYTILPPSGLHVAEIDKKDVSRTEIRLDPSIYFRMERIHVNMSCLSILQYLFHLCCSMFYNWITILLYKACKGKTAMLESEGLQTRSLQKIQTPGDNKPTPFFIDTAPTQRNPTPIDNKQIPVAKELVRCCMRSSITSFSYHLLINELVN